MVTTGNKSYISHLLAAMAWRLESFYEFFLTRFSMFDDVSLPRFVFEEV